MWGSQGVTCHRARDASTTLRIYSHALPLTDADAALDQLYRVSTDS